MKRVSLMVLMGMLVACGPELSQAEKEAKVLLEKLGFTKVVIKGDDNYAACPLDFKPGVDFEALDRNGTPVTGVVCCTPSSDGGCAVRWSY